MKDDVAEVMEEAVLEMVKAALSPEGISKIDADLPPGKSALPRNGLDWPAIHYGMCSVSQSMMAMAMEVIGQCRDELVNIRADSPTDMPRAMKLMQSSVMFNAFQMILMHHSQLVVSHDILSTNTADKHYARIVAMCEASKAKVETHGYSG